MMRKLLIILLAAVLAGVAGGAASLLVGYKLGVVKPWETEPKTTAPTPPPPSQVTASGRIRPRSGVINISGVPGDRLMMLDQNLVKEGKPVTKGQTLAVLESSVLRQAEYDLAQSQLEDAEAKEKAETKYAAALKQEAELANEQVALEKRDREAQLIKIAALKTQKESADDDLRRLNDVRAQSHAAVVADQTLEHQKAAVAKAESELSAAESQLKKLDASVELAERQAQAKLATADASMARIPSIVQLNSLRKNVALAKQRLDMTTVRAPSDGRIVKVFLSEGETIAQQPILQMVDTSQMVVVAEIPEEQRYLVKVGERASIESKALREKAPRGTDEDDKAPRLHGTVEHVGTIVARNPVAPSSPTAPADKHVVEALIKLDPDDVEPASRLIELEVLVTIPDSKAAPSAGNGPNADDA